MSSFPLDAVNAALPPALSPAAGLFLALTSLATSFLTAAVGIGGGLVLLAVMSSLIPVSAVIPVHGVVQLGSNLGRAAIMIRSVRLTILGPFGAGALLGAITGGLVVVELPPVLMQVAIALFVLGAAWLPAPPAIARSRATLLIGGAVSSFLTMFFGATGPFVAASLKLKGLPRLVHVANLSACMSLQHGLKIATFGLLGFAFAPYLPLMTAMIAMGFLGTVAGRLVLLRLSERLFRLVLRLVLTVLALRLLITAIMAMLTD